jgi:hypothetical protein
MCFFRFFCILPFLFFVLFNRSGKGWLGWGLFIIPGFF